MRDGGKSGGKPRAKGKKHEKGGSRKFVASLEEMTLRDQEEEQKQMNRKARRQDGDDEDGSDDDEDDEDEDEEGDDGVVFDRSGGHQKSLFGFSQSAEGPEFVKQKKASGIAAIVKIENPNLAPKQNKVIKAKDMQTNVEQQLSRREREAIEKERAAAAYMKKHLAGETTEAKRDLARLAEVRRRREEAEKRRLEEEAAAKEREKNKKVVEKDDDDEILDARAIKALKPAVLKEKLKERGLSIQGQKKDLIQRLIDYEDERAL